MTYLKYNSSHKSIVTNALLSIKIDALQEKFPVEFRLVLLNGWLHSIEFKVSATAGYTVVDWGTADSCRAYGITGHHRFFNKFSFIRELVEPTEGFYPISLIGL